MPYGPLGEWYDPELLRVARDLRERFMPDPGFSPGLIVEHRDGYKVRIEGGQYLDQAAPVARISNHWQWHPVDDAGERSGETVSGYGSELVSPLLGQVVAFPVSAVDIR